MSTTLNIDSATSMKCHSYGCDNCVVADVQWGSYQIDGLSPQTMTTCQHHLERLWDHVRPLATLGLMWFRIDRPGSLTGQRSDDASLGHDLPG
jgi:hypothetical protein